MGIEDADDLIEDIQQALEQAVDIADIAIPVKQRVVVPHHTLVTIPESTTTVA